MSSYRYNEVMVNSKASNYEVFGNDALQLLNTIRDEGLLNLADSMHKYVFGLPNSNKGILSGLEKAAESLCTAVAMDVVWGYLSVKDGSPNDLDFATFKAWMLNIPGEHKGEAECTKIYGELARLGKSAVITKECWCNPINIANLGEGVFPAWKIILESALSFENDTSIIVDKVRAHGDWQKAERIMGPGILGKNDDDVSASTEGIFGEIRSLMDKGLYTPADKAIVYRNWEFDSSSRMSQCKAAAERLVGELDRMSVTATVKEKKGRLPNLTEYFTHPDRVDYNSCFLAAQYLNEIVSKGEAANMVQEFILEVELIRDPN